MQSQLDLNLIRPGNRCPTHILDIEIQEFMEPVEMQIEADPGLPGLDCSHGVATGCTKSLNGRDDFFVWTGLSFANQLSQMKSVLSSVDFHSIART